MLGNLRLNIGIYVWLVPLPEAIDSVVSLGYVEVGLWRF